MKTMTRVMIIFITMIAGAHTSSAQWKQTNGPFRSDSITYSYVTSLANMGNTLFAADRYYGIGAYRSTDGGSSWALLESQVGLAGFGRIYSFFVSDTNLFVAAIDGAFLSTNRGDSWSLLTNGLPNNTFDIDVYCFSACGSSLFAGGAAGTYRSTDNGASWVKVNNYPTVSFGVKDSIILAGINRQMGILRSSDYGTTWQLVNSGFADFANCFAIKGSDIFVATENTGVCHSTDNGLSWTPTSNGLPNPTVNSIKVVGSDLIAATNNGICVSTDDGLSWFQVTSNLPVWTASSGLVTTLSLATIGDTLFAGTWGGVWKRPLSQVMTVNAKTKQYPPEAFELLQNYPNPFNPITQIDFQVPSSSFVTLKIFDVLGREVATLFAKEAQLGHYSVSWNAVNNPSGVYFSALHFANRTLTKKLILLK